jgi:cytochrome P450
MLMHILSSDDETLMPRVMKELDMVKRPDGTLDVPTLISLPLLQSIFQEVLRMYTDVLVTRLAHKDLVLPINDQNQQVLIKKGTVAMAPSWIAHHDEDTWLDPPCETFYAERFLKKDPETGKETFTLTSTNGKLFPFGGGKSICPGRVFAKQEVLGSLAMTLLTFDFELLGFLDEQGKDTTKFPSIRNAFLGTGVVVAGGDLKVRIRKRTSKQE